VLRRPVEVAAKSGHSKLCSYGAKLLIHHEVHAHIESLGKYKSTGTAIAEPYLYFLSENLINKLIITNKTDNQNTTTNILTLNGYIFRSKKPIRQIAARSGDKEINNFLFAVISIFY
jgi:hypothetical protein